MYALSCINQKWKNVCEQKWTWLRLKDGAVQENLGFEFLVWCVAEIKDVANWGMAFS